MLPAGCPRRPDAVAHLAVLALKSSVAWTSKLYLKVVFDKLRPQNADRGEEVNNWFGSLRPGLCLLMLTVVTTAAPAADKPLKVFILAGQSNMQGHANLSTFDSMADDPKTAPILKEMRGPDGTPRVCEKVWISSVGCLGDG